VLHSRHYAPHANFPPSAFPYEPGSERSAVLHMLRSVGISIETPVRMKCQLTQSRNWFVRRSLINVWLRSGKATNRS